MRPRDSTWVAESDAAASEATKGALSGAAKVLISVSSVTPPHYSFIVSYCAGNGAACKVDCLRLMIDFVVTCLAYTVGNYRGVLGSGGACALANL